MVANTHNQLVLKIAIEPYKVCSNLNVVIKTVFLNKFPSLILPPSYNPVRQEVRCF